MKSISKRQFSLAESLTSTASPGHYRVALVASTLLTLVALLILPYARQAVAHVPAFLPAYAMLAIFADLMTAYLLFGQFMSTRTLALGVLAATYYFSGLTVIPYILTFPAVFSPTGLFHANEQTAIWLFVCWHTGFPCGILAYLLVDKRYGMKHISPRTARILLLTFVTVIPILVLLCAFVAVDSSHLLPLLIQHNVFTPLFSLGFGLVGGAIPAIAFLILALRFRRLTIMHIWLGVTTLATFLDIILTLYANSRYTVGWYFARTNSLWASIFVLSALLYQVNRLYVELAQQTIALDSQNVELEKRHKRQKDVVSVVGHEFRGALISMGGFSEVMRDTECSPAEVKEYANYINEDALRITRLINDMLDLDLMESGHIELHVESIDLNTLIEERAIRARLAITHPIHLSLDATVPHIEGDADKLAQVVTNLLNNASKYSPDGGTIVVGSEQLDGFFHFYVEDHGIGISQDKLHEIFDPYSRVSSDTTRNISGAGLGLSIVREIIGLHGGKIWVESHLGEGSIFHVLLPFSVNAPPVLKKTSEKNRIVTRIT